MMSTSCTPTLNLATLPASTTACSYHVVLVVGSVRPGGAERVITILANYWAAQGMRVTLLTFDEGSTPPYYALAPEINWRPLDIFRPTNSPWSALISNVRQVRKLGREINDAAPDAVVAFLEQTNILSILATRGTGIPVIISERNHPGLSPLPKAWRILRRLAYPFASRLVVQTSRICDFFPSSWGQRIRVIANPVVKPSYLRSPCEKPNWERRKIVTVGRLVPQKGFDLVIRAFAPIATKYPDWDIDIWGEGQCRQELQILIDSLHLTTRIQLRGNTPDVQQRLAESDLFVFASRFEGFPNALCEAMACGLPAISADCHFGPREIIRDEIDGLLVEPDNVEALQIALDRLLADDLTRARLAARAPEILERFGIEKIIEQWDSLLYELRPKSVSRPQA